MNRLLDIKIWIILGLILGFVIGFDHPDASTMLIITLMAQMTLALHGTRFEVRDIVSSRKEVLICMFLSFVFNTGITLLTGLLFIDNTALWYGWIMLSAVPCAISVITLTFYMKGDMKTSMLGFAGIYIVALAVTPLLTHILMGDAVSWIRILEYVLLFVVVPIAVDIPLNKVNIPHVPKVMALNIIIMIMVFISIGFRRDYIISNPDVAFWLLIANFVRIFIPSIILIYFMKHIGCDRGKSISYMAMSTWRNSGLAATLCIVMFASTYPDAVLPAVLSLLVENVWFLFMKAAFDKMWPIPEPSDN